MANNISRKNSIAVQKGIYTEKVMDKFEKTYKMRPINTVAEWNSLGFSIPKGTKPVAWCNYWVKKDSVPENQVKYIKREGTLDDGTVLALVGVNLFTIDQVKPRFADISTRLEEMKASLQPKKASKPSKKVAK